MGKFRIKKFKSHLKGAFGGINIVVETGTFKGDSTRVMAQNFSKVYTIELDEALHKATSEKLKAEGLDNIEFILGDSGDKIESLTREIKEPAIFFLDAHWSGDTSVDWDSSRWKGYGVNTAHLGASDTPTGEEQVPLNKEMNAIANNFHQQAVIYIDDLKNFDFWGRGKKNRAFEGEDYSHIDLNDYKRILGHRIVDWINTDEQLIIKLDKSPETEEDKIRLEKHFHGALKRKIFFRNIKRVLKRIFVYPVLDLYWIIFKGKKR